MSHTFVYTFRTNPYIAKLEESGAKIFVLGKLKEDMPQMLDAIAHEQPKRIAGVALVRGVEETRAETEAINQFGRYGKKVNAHGKERYALVNPDPHTFRYARTSTHSFCNWAAYKVAEYVAEHRIAAAHSFIHFRADDIELLHGYLCCND